MTARPLASVITPLMGRLACRVGLHAPSLYHERAGLRFWVCRRPACTWVMSERVAWE